MTSSPLRVEAHRLADRNVDLVRRHEDLRRIVVLIDELPPPLMAADLDRQSRLGRRIGDLAPSSSTSRRPGRPARSSRGRRRSRSTRPPRAFQERSVRDGAASPAAENRDQDQRRDDDDDDGGDDQQTLRQRQNSRRHQTVGVQDTHRRRGCAAGQAQTPRRAAVETIVSLAKPIAAHSPTGFWPSLKAAREAPRLRRLQELGGRLLDCWRWRRSRDRSSECRARRMGDALDVGDELPDRRFRQDARPRRASRWDAPDRC